LVQKRRFLKPDEQTSLLLSEPLHTLLLGSHCTPLTRMMTLEKPMAKDIALPRQQLPWMIFAASHNEYKYQKKSFLRYLKRSKFPNLIVAASTT
jgi:hypothetical protein